MLVQVGNRWVSEQREIDPTFAKGMKELLSKSKVFKDCHEEFIRDLIVSANRKEYAPNRYLMEEGARGDSMFVLYKGVVEVTANGRYVCKLRDGSIVGEAALLNIDNRRTASVRSVEKCGVAIIFRSAFHSILEKYPWEKRKFQREMKAKLMELGKLIDVKEDINLEQQAIQCDALKKVPFFASHETLHDFVAELAMEAVSCWFQQGKVIIQEGDTQCDKMYVLLKGAVDVSACGKHLGRLENDLFGELCVLDLLERRTANVTTVSQCHCMVFTREKVILVLAKYPDARMRLLEHARQRLMALNEAISSDDGVKSRSLPGLGSSGNRVPGLGPPPELGSPAPERFQLSKEEQLERLKLKTCPIDHMFMKFPALRDDGTRAPRIDALHECLAETCGSISWREGSDILQPLTDGRRKLPALSAR